MSVSERRKGSRWWTDNRVFRFVFVVVMTLTFPPCMGLEENERGDPGEVVEFYWADVIFTYRDSVTNKQVNETAKGKYEAQGLVEQRTGIVMHVHDKENKSQGFKEYINKIPQVPWIALIENGGCFFSDKIKMATQTYNATAVVIYNNGEDSITILTHKAKMHVSIFVSQQTGRKLAKLADMGLKVEMTIIPGKKETTVPQGSQNSISKTSVLFVSISFIVLMIISLAWLVFYYIQRFRFAHAKERLARRLTSAAKKAIAKIPQKTVKNGDRELDSDFDQCAVCIEGYKPHDVIRTLPCRHVFHKSCVDPWLLDQRSCPMCKLDILRAFGMQVMGSQESIHQDPENGNIPAPVEEREPSSSIDDQAVPDTEVKVLLLPHTCLHLHSDQDTAAPGTSEGECHPSVHPIKSSASSERLMQLSSHDSEMQALMSARRDEEEEEDEECDRNRSADHSLEKDGRYGGADAGSVEQFAAMFSEEKSEDSHVEDC